VHLVTLDSGASRHTVAGTEIWQNTTMKSPRQSVIKETRGNSKTLHAEPPASKASHAALPKLDCRTIVKPIPTPKTPAASPLSELDQWVSGERLLAILWDERSRPSLQWIRKETKRKMLPHVRRGRLIFYRPRSVMEWFNQRECRPNSMK
jgi:hypothetical protein